MKQKLFENVGGNQFKLRLEVEDKPIFIDRHGSFPNRPKSVRFKHPEDYNDHMGFDAALTGAETYPPEQIKSVRELMKQGFKVTGHSKIPGGNAVEILMTLNTRTGSQYRDVQPDGKY